MRANRPSITTKLYMKFDRHNVGITIVTSPILRNYYYTKILTPHDCHHLFPRQTVSSRQILTPSSLRPYSVSPLKSGVDIHPLLVLNRYA